MKYLRIFLMVSIGMLVFCGASLGKAHHHKKTKKIPVHKLRSHRSRAHKLHHARHNTQLKHHKHHSQKSYSATRHSAANIGNLNKISQNYSDRAYWNNLVNDMHLRYNPNDKNIQHQIAIYRRSKQSLEHDLIRARPYFYYISQELKRKNMPAELVLLPMVESNYNPNAYSYANAVGLWQLTPPTARRFGIRANLGFDGRRDLALSTSAALSHLNYLHREFHGDWLNAIAAYNSGSGKMRSAIRHNERRGLPHDFWSLNLPRQTERYVPKLLALVTMIKYADRYHLRLPCAANSQYLSYRTRWHNQRTS